MIRAAIVGLGWWGQTLTNSVQGKSDLIRMVAATTRTPAKAEGFCKEKSIPLYKDLDTILSDKNIDAVVLATPHSEHSSQVQRAAAAGKHIYVEKPFTLDVADAEPALAAVKKAGVTLAVGFQRRFAPNVVELKRRLDAGELGVIGHCETEATAHAGLAMAADSWRTNPEETPAGAMTGLGIHPLDNMIALFGPVDEAYCTVVRRAAKYADDTTSVMLKFKNGMTGSLFCSLTTAPSYRIAVFGSKAYAEISRPMLDLLRINPVPGAPGTPPAAPEVIEKPVVDLLKVGLEAFATAAKGGTPYPTTPDQIRQGVAAFEAVVRSSKSGKPEKVAL